MCTILRCTMPEMICVGTLKLACWQAELARAITKVIGAAGASACQHGWVMVGELFRWPASTDGT
jgi:hypothetical protein